MKLFDIEEIRDFEGTKIVYFQSKLSNGEDYEVSFLAGSGLPRKKLRKVAWEAMEIKQKELDENSSNPTK